MEKFIDACIASHPELLENKVGFIQVTDGYNGYDIELECSRDVIAGLYPTDTWDMKTILAICERITDELKTRGVRVVEDRQEWETIEEESI